MAFASLVDDAQRRRRCFAAASRVASSICFGHERRSLAANTPSDGPWSLEIANRRFIMPLCRGAPGFVRHAGYVLAAMKIPCAIFPA